MLQVPRRTFTESSEAAAGRTQRLAQVVTEDLVTDMTTRGDPEKEFVRAGLTWCSIKKHHVRFALFWTDTGMTSLNKNIFPALGRGRGEVPPGFIS